MDVIIAAGGIPQPEDPMYPYTQGKPKALIDMNGRTSLERVVDALQDSKYVEDIVVVGLGDDMGQTFKRPVHHVPDPPSLDLWHAVARWHMLRYHQPLHRWPADGQVIRQNVPLPRFCRFIVFACAARALAKGFEL